MIYLFDSKEKSAVHAKNYKIGYKTANDAKHHCLTEYLFLLCSLWLREPAHSEKHGRGDEAHTGRGAQGQSAQTWHDFYFLKSILFHQRLLIESTVNNLLLGHQNCLLRVIKTYHSSRACN